MPERKDAAKKIVKQPLPDHSHQPVRTLLPLLPDDPNRTQEEVCINGKWTIVQRGVEVDIPWCVYELLRQAGRLES